MQYAALAPGLSINEMTLKFRNVLIRRVGWLVGV